MDGKELNMGMKRTKETRMIEEFLKEYFPDYPSDYPPTAYRADSNFIHIRIVDRSFKGVPWMDRYDMVLPAIHLLPEKTQRDIVLFVLFSPDEVEKSGLNHEFENPSPIPRFSGRSRNGKGSSAKRKQPRTVRGARK
jgi:hypothetical protein